MKACRTASWLCSAVIGLLLAGSRVDAQNVYCVRVGATGANNGLDWINAYPALPATLVRGATYYVAGGNYASYTFSTADSGTSMITIRRATAANHGPAGGWSSAYDSQVVFTGPLTFLTDYWLLDGQQRAGWTNGYGIKVQWVSGTGVHLIDLAPLGGSIGNNSVRYVEVAGSAMRDGVTQDRGIQFCGGSNYTIEYCYIHDNDNCPFLSRDVKNATIQYCYLARNHYTAAQHSEGWSISGNCTNIVVRFNQWIDIEGTALICTPTVGHPQCGGPSLCNWYIYGNVFAYTSWGNANSQGFGDGIFYLFDTQAHGDMMFYNNTIANIQKGLSVSIGCDNSGGSDGCADHLYVRNNLFCNNAFQVAPANANVTDFKWEYNAYAAQSYSDSDANLQVMATSPLVNIGADWHLTAGTSNGIALSSQFNTDMDGNTRGADGVWDRGAYEFNGVANTNPPQISSVTASSVGSTNAGITWTTDKGSSSVVFYGLTTGYGSAVTNTGLTQQHAMTLSGLSPNTVYHYAVQSADQSGRTSTSGDFNFQTLVLDTTPPTVSLTVPSAGAVLSNTISLTATATDNVGGSGVAFVTFTVDGVVVAIVSNAQYTATWNSATVTNGSHTLQAIAQDNAGNAASSGNVSVTVQNSVVFGPGPVGYWAFNEGSGTVALDSSGNGNNGTLLNGPAWVAGESGDALQLDGVAAYARVPDNAVLDPTAAVSVSAWVQLSTNGTYQTVLEKLAAEGSNTYPFCDYGLVAVDVGGGYHARVSVTSGGNFNYVDSTAIISYGAWHLLTGVYDGSVLTVYVDGAASGTLATSGSVRAGGQALYIGHNGAGGDGLKGIVDDVRVYNRALSAAEVSSLFTASVPSPPSNLHVLQ